MELKFKKIDDLKKWDDFKKEVLELAKKHGITYLSESFNDPVLITLSWAPTRSFDGIEESFVAEKSLWEQVKPILINNEIYFGEIAGKHSEIYGNLDTSEVSETTSPQVISSWVESNGKHKKILHSFIETLCSNLGDRGDKPSEHQLLLNLINSLK